MARVDRARRRALCQEAINLIVSRILRARSQRMDVFMLFCHISSIVHTAERGLAHLPPLEGLGNFNYTARWGDPPVELSLQLTEEQRRRRQELAESLAITGAPPEGGVEPDDPWKDLA